MGVQRKARRKQIHQILLQSPTIFSSGLPELNMVCSVHIATFCRFLSQELLQLPLECMQTFSMQNIISKGSHKAICSLKNNLLLLVKKLGFTIKQASIFALNFCTGRDKNYFLQCTEENGFKRDPLIASSNISAVMMEDNTFLHSLPHLQPEPLS